MDVEHAHWRPVPGGHQESDLACLHVTGRLDGQGILPNGGGLGRHELRGGQAQWVLSLLLGIGQGSPQIAIGMRVAVYNSRGAHARGEGGDQEREIAEKFMNWARQLVFSHPYVANLIEQIASGYEQDAMREDSETAVRRRLRR